MTYIDDFANLTCKRANLLTSHRNQQLSARLAGGRHAVFSLSAVIAGIIFLGLSPAQAAVSPAISSATAITVGRTPVTGTDKGGTPAVTLPKGSASYPILVVTTNQSLTASAANCTPQAGPITGKDAACGLADALAYAAKAGSANISFSATVFKAANTASENTITVAAGSVSNTGAISYLPFTIPANTTITGPTTIVGGLVTNLVTIQGKTDSISPTQYGTVIFQINAVSGVNLSGLNLSGGQGAISSSGTVTVSNCLITNNATLTYGGGIANFGQMTVNDSSISGNISPLGEGGGIYNTGSLTVLGSTISGNTSSGTNAFGGGIYNTGTLTVVNSTIAGNTAASGLNANGSGPFNGAGGGIFDTGTLTLISSTISANTLSGVTSQSGLDGGGGLYGSGVLANSIVSGNTANAGGNDLEDAPDTNFTPYNSFTGLSSSQIFLAPLGNYGGATQTMLPMPNSPAICNGSLLHVPAADSFTDQRGLARTGSYEASGVSPIACVDAGAVQTDYSLRFAAQPPSIAKVGVAFNPAPAVALIENGNPFTSYDGLVSLSDSANILSSGSVALTNGVATFTDVTLAGAVESDLISASMMMANQSDLSVVGTAGQAVTVATIPGVITTPAPGSVLSSGTVTFTWTPSNILQCQYVLQIGTDGQGTNNIYISPTITSTSVTVPNLPTTGAPLYVSLSQGGDTPWIYTPYVYTEATITPGVVVSAPPTSKLNHASSIFIRKPDTGATR